MSACSYGIDCELDEILTEDCNCFNVESHRLAACGPCRCPFYCLRCEYLANAVEVSDAE